MAVPPQARRGRRHALVVISVWRDPGPGAMKLRVTLTDLVSGKEWSRVCRSVDDMCVSVTDWLTRLNSALI